MAAFNEGFASFPSLWSDQVCASKHLECTICLEYFVKPKLLPCSHTFCEHCLERIISKRRQTQEWRPYSGDSFQCPNCNEVIAVPANGAAGFKTNFYIADDLERLKADRLCSICSNTATGKGQRASRICQDCDLALCKTCARSHMTHFQNHETARILDKVPTIPSRSANCPLGYEFKEAGDVATDMCEKHRKEELRFYCQPCGLPICRDCRVTSHYEHTEVIDLADAAEQATDQLKVIKEELQSRADNLEWHLQVLQDRRERTAETTQDVKTLLNSRAEIMELVKMHRDQMISRLEQEASHLDVTFDIESTEAFEKLSLLSDAQDRVSRCLDNGGACDLVKIETEMHDILKQEPPSSDTDPDDENAAGANRFNGFYLNCDNVDITAQISRYMGTPLQLWRQDPNFGHDYE